MPLTPEELHRIVAVHTRAASGERCSSCGFVYDKTHPLCPVAAKALRALAGRSPRQHKTGTSPLSAFSDTDLLRLAGQHRPARGGHRCARCGLSYTGGCAECPTLRAVRIELEARGFVPMTGRPGRGLCAGKGRSWEIEGNGPTEWKRAIDTCYGCPLFVACHRAMNAAVQRGEPPASLIMGGIAFDSNGNAIPTDQLDVYSQRRAGKGISNRPPRGATGQVPEGHDAVRAA
ncbi:hypothetical protein [Rhodococcus rhodochrous]|uniref:hypothetical protein n=1 Tax=Rhodococcus rhodochrous TaxID=1829 RepID=UPI001EE702A5|nr:hypothetical protein [Rhodococcus rhodochrous]